MISKFCTRLFLLIKQKLIVEKGNSKNDENPIAKIISESNVYYKKKDLIYFEEINAYGAFKYDVVKEIMHSSSFGIDSGHISLNKIYFQTDKERHNHNRRTAIKHLKFISKKLQYEDSKYTATVYEFLKAEFPNKKVFNLIDYLINPLVLGNALNELGFLPLLPEFNPNSSNFSCSQMIRTSKEIYPNKDFLEYKIKQNLTNKNIPELMQALLNDFSIENGYTQEDLPHFFTTLILAAVESTASFTTSMVYFVLKDYPELLELNNHQKITYLGNELLRIYSPNPTASRMVLENMSFDGIDLKKGDSVILFLGAANRDPSVFKEPLKIKFRREEKHLAFGRGQIACIGEFAAFRMARNLIGYISKDSEKISIFSDYPTFVIDSIQKIKELNIVYNA